MLARNAWEKRKLGETNSYFTDGNYGESYPKESELSDKENGVPFLRGSNLRNGELIEDNANYITKEKHAELTSGHLVEDDIVLAVRGSLGALGYVKEENIDWNINSQLAVIRTDKSELSGKFLAQFLLSWRGQKELLSRNTGTALKQLPIKQLKDVPVPIVNLDEQKEISALFTSIDNLIAATQDKIDALEQAKRALLQRLFDQSWRFKGYSDPWEKRKLSEVTNLITKGTTPREKGGRGEVNFIKVENLSKNGNIFTTSKVSVSEHQGYLARSILQENDILFSIAGSLGRTAIVPKLVLPANTNQALAIIRLSTGCVEFVATYLSGEAIDRYIRRNPTVGAQPNISLTQVASLQIDWPSLHEQEVISKLFARVKDLIAATQSRLSSLELLKKALLQDLFI